MRFPSISRCCQIQGKCSDASEDFHLNHFLKITACLWVLWVLAGMVLVSAGLLTRAQSADVAIVLGNTVYRDGSPSPRLAARLDRASQCFQQRQCRFIFVSGGVDASGTDEAATMRAYLMRRGIAADSIVVDSAGGVRISVFKAG